jgi:hypothetical protein
MRRANSQGVHVESVYTQLLLEMYRRGRCVCVPRATVRHFMVLYSSLLRASSPQGDWINGTGNPKGQHSLIHKALSLLIKPTRIKCRCSFWNPAAVKVARHPDMGGGNPAARLPDIDRVNCHFSNTGTTVSQS